MASQISSTIDKASLASFIKHSPSIEHIELAVSKAANLRIVFADSFVEAYGDSLDFLGLKNMAQMEELLLRKESFLTRFLTAWFRGAGDGRLNFIPSGISISFLCWTVALEKGGLPALTDFLAKHAFNKNQDIGKLAAGIEGAYKEII